MPKFESSRMNGVAVIAKTYTHTYTPTHTHTHTHTHIRVKQIKWVYCQPTPEMGSMLSTGLITIFKI